MYISIKCLAAFVTSLIVRNYFSLLFFIFYLNHSVCIVLVYIHSLILFSISPSIHRKLCVPLGYFSIVRFWWDGKEKIVSFSYIVVVVGFFSFCFVFVVYLYLTVYFISTNVKTRLFQTSAFGNIWHSFPFYIALCSTIVHFTECVWILTMLFIQNYRHKSKDETKKKKKRRIKKNNTQISKQKQQQRYKTPHTILWNATTTQ